MTKITLLLLPILTLFATACSNNAGPTLEDVGLRADSMVADTVVYLTPPAKTPYCHVSLHLAMLQGKGADALNRMLLDATISPMGWELMADKKATTPQAVRSFIRSYTGEYKTIYASLFSQDREHPASYTLEYKVKTRLQDNENGILNYRALIYSATGDTTPMQCTVARNLNLRTRQIIPPDSFFVAGYERSLQERLMQKLEEVTDTHNMQELNAKGLLLGGPLTVTDNWVIGRDEVSFIYIENEIAPRALGEIVLTLPMSDIKDLIKKEN